MWRNGCAWCWFKDLVSFMPFPDHIDLCYITPDLEIRKKGVWAWFIVNSFMNNFNAFMNSGSMTVGRFFLIAVFFSKSITLTFMFVVAAIIQPCPSTAISVPLFTMYFLYVSLMYVSLQKYIFVMFALPSVVGFWGGNLCWLLVSSYWLVLGCHHCCLCNAQHLSHW